jgi:hypothetical protein
MTSSQGLEKVKQILLITAGVLFLAILIYCINLTVSINQISFPSAPVLTDSASATIQEAKTKEITNYQTVTATLIKQKVDLYDQVIIKTLLPLLTGLITGIFTYIIAGFGIESFRNYAIEKERIRQSVK